MKKIKLTQGKYALIDDKDYKNISQYTWWSMKGAYTFYARTEVKRKCLLMHRIIMNAKKGQIVDHRDGDGLDNRRKNLRIVTCQQNLWNWRNKHKGASKYKGVHWVKNCKKWRAQITHNSKVIYLGMSTNEKDMARAYDKAVEKYRGKMGVPNNV